MTISAPITTGPASTNAAANQGNTVLSSNGTVNTVSNPTQTSDAITAGKASPLASVTPIKTLYSSGANATPQSTTTLSSNKSADIANINNKQTDLSKSGVTTQIGPDGNPISTYANGSAVNTPSNTTETSTTSTNQTNADGTSATGGYNGNIYVRPGDPIPKDSQGNPITLTTTSPQDDANIKTITDLKAQFDANGVQQLQNIENSYNNLIAQQTQANTGQQAQTNNALLMGGATGQGSSSQYAPVSSAAILGAQISYGLQQLSNLNAQKQQAISAAKQAIQDGDFKYAAKLQDQADKITKTQQDSMNKMNDTIIANNQKLADEKLQSTKDNAIADIYSQGTTDPTKILAALQKAGNTSITMSDINSTLKTISENAPSKDYLQYQNDTQKKGLVPLNYSDWKDAQDKKASALKSSDAYNSAYASAKGKAAGEAAGSGTTYDENGNVIQTGNMSALDIGRYNRAATAATKTFKDSMVFKASQNAAFYLSKIKSAVEGTGSIGDQEILDSISQFNTGGGRVTESQVNLILNGKSLSDSVNAWSNKIKNGGILSDSQRQQALKLAQATAESFAGNYKQKYDNLAANLDKQKIPKEFWGIPTPDELKGEVSSNDLIQQHQDNENKITTNIQNLKTSNPEAYKGASAMMTTVNKDTGQPYSAEDILQAFPELDTQVKTPDNNNSSDSSLFGINKPFGIHIPGL